MRLVTMALIGAGMVLGACAAEPPESDLSKGLAAIKENRLSDAELAFNNILAQDPNDAFANLNLGLVKAETGRREEAIGHYQLAVANGEGIVVQSIVRTSGATENVTSTVADVARRNLENLGV